MWRAGWAAVATHRAALSGITRHRSRPSRISFDSISGARACAAALEARSRANTAMQRLRIVAACACEVE